VKSESNEVLIIGMGNEFRSDDAAGLLAARWLADRFSEKESPGVKSNLSNQAIYPIELADRRVGSRPCANQALLWRNSVKVLELAGDATRLLEVWRDVGKVIIIDAVSSGAAPGTVHRVQLGELGELGELATLSTHGFGLAQAVRFAAALRELPPQLFVYGIEGRSFDLGTEVSPEVARAVDLVVESILEEVGCTSTVLPGT
jgi:hydrogenase maturation protease